MGKLFKFGAEITNDDMIMAIGILLVLLFMKYLYSNYKNSFTESDSVNKAYKIQKSMDVIHQEAKDTQDDMEMYIQHEKANEKMTKENDLQNNKGTRMEILMDKLKDSNSNAMDELVNQSAETTKKVNDALLQQSTQSLKIAEDKKMMDGSGNRMDSSGNDLYNEKLAAVSRSSSSFSPFSSVSPFSNISYSYL